MIRGLDDDEVEFLDMVDKNRLEAEKRAKLEDFKVLQEFREKAKTQTVDLKEVLSAELNGTKPKPKPQVTTRPSQKSILSGLVKKRSISEADEPGTAAKKSKPVVATAILPKATTAAANSLECVGILPGIGSYRDTSDSNDSSDAEEPAPGLMVDLCGRLLKKVCEKSVASGEH